MKKRRIVTILICITLLMASIFVFSACEIGDLDPNGDITIDTPTDDDGEGYKKESEGLTYQLNTEGTAYTVTGIGTCTDTDLVIPSMYNGLPVTSIGYEAFGICRSLMSVTIGNSVTSIGGYAFSYCPSLTSIVIPDSVESIGSHAFYDCDSLTSVTIGNNVESIGMYAFQYCYKLVEVINKSRLNIKKDGLMYQNNSCVGEYALNVKTSGESEIVNKDGYLFYMYNNVNYLLGYVGSETNLTLPDSYNGENYEIYKYAFSGCDSLTSITLPDSVMSIGCWAFLSCSNLTNVTFENPDGWYVSSGTDLDLSDAEQNATYLKSTYFYYYWYKA